MEDLVMTNRILDEDIEYIRRALSARELEFFGGRSVLITGCAGFLGYTFLHFFTRLARELKLRQVIGLDSFILGRPAWLDRLAAENPVLQLHAADIRSTDLGKIPGAQDADLVIHMASIASPTYYRKHPIETLEANIWGLRALFDFYKERKIAGLLFFSSSEVYGDPPADQVPTSESYRGNVAMIGPRACYDEAKRCGETMSYLYAERYGLPVSIVRPFNNYGPGMKLDDRRVPADFAKAVLANQDIQIFSDGKPTRTFCYVADAITGYLKALAHGKFEFFNIGIEKPETSVEGLAEIYRRAGAQICGYSGKVVLAVQSEQAYLTDNPNRRCPRIDKARELLGFAPTIEVEAGVRRFLEFIVANRGEL